MHLPTLLSTTTSLLLTTLAVPGSSVPAPAPANSKHLQWWQAAPYKFTLHFKWTNGGALTMNAIEPSVCMPIPDYVHAKPLKEVVMEGKDYKTLLYKNACSGWPPKTIFTNTKFGSSTAKWDGYTHYIVELQGA